MGTCKISPEYHRNIIWKSEICKNGNISWEHHWVGYTIVTIVRLDHMSGFMINHQAEIWFRRHILIQTQTPEFAAHPECHL